MFGILDVNTRRNSNISNLYLTLASNCRNVRGSENVPTITETEVCFTGSNVLDGTLPPTWKHDVPRLDKKISDGGSKKIENQFTCENTYPRNASKTRSPSGNETHISNYLRSIFASSSNSVTDIAAFIFVSIFALASFPWMCFTAIGSMLILILAFSFISFTAFWLFCLVYIAVSTFSLVFALMLLVKRFLP